MRPYNRPMHWWPAEWSYVRLFPELELFETKSERDKAFREAKGFPISWRAVPFLMSLAAGIVIVGALERRFRFLPSWLRGALQGLVCGFGGVWFCWFFRREVQRNLRRQLLQKGVAVCMGCGYQLCGLTAPRCPECGEPFDPRLLESAPPIESRR